MSVKVFLGFLLIASSLAIVARDNSDFVFLISEDVTEENKASVEGCKIQKDKWNFLQIDHDNKLDVTLKGGNEGQVTWAAHGADIPDIKVASDGTKFNDPCKIDIYIKDTSVSSATGSLCFVKYGDIATLQLCSGDTPSGVGCTLPASASQTNLAAVDDTLNIKIGSVDSTLSSSATAKNGSGEVPADVKDTCEIDVKVKDEQRLNIV